MFERGQEGHKMREERVSAVSIWQRSPLGYWIRISKQRRNGHGLLQGTSGLGEIQFWGWMGRDLWNSMFTDLFGRYRIEDINTHCLAEFRKHWTCLDNNNQQLWQCRPEEWKLNKCVFDKLVRICNISMPSIVRNIRGMRKPTSNHC